MTDVAGRCGAKVHAEEVPWGETFEPDAIAGAGLEPTPAAIAVIDELGRERVAAVSKERGRVVATIEEHKAAMVRLEALEQALVDDDEGEYEEGYEEEGAPEE